MSSKLNACGGDDWTTVSKFLNLHHLIDPTVPGKEDIPTGFAIMLTTNEDIVNTMHDDDLFLIENNFSPFTTLVLMFLRRVVDNDPRYEWLDDVLQYQHTLNGAVESILEHPYLMDSQVLHKKFASTVVGQMIEKELNFVKYNYTICTQDLPQKTNFKYSLEEWIYCATLVRMQSLHHEVLFRDLDECNTQDKYAYVPWLCRLLPSDTNNEANVKLEVDEDDIKLVSLCDIKAADPFIIDIGEPRTVCDILCTFGVFNNSMKYICLAMLEVFLPMGYNNDYPTVVAKYEYCDALEPIDQVCRFIIEIDDIVLGTPTVVTLFNILKSIIEYECPSTSPETQTDMETKCLKRLAKIVDTRITELRTSGAEPAIIDSEYNVLELVVRLCGAVERGDGAYIEQTTPWYSAWAPLFFQQYKATAKIEPLST